jgi:patatin-like phospholipase/acyl hydrolase
LDRETIKVLTIDGGGVRGIIPATFCKHLETIMGSTVPMWKLFDFIVGTSTGGVMTMLLARPDPDHPGQAMFSADDCINLYLQQGRDLFSSSPDYLAKNAGHQFPEFPESSVAAALQGVLRKPDCELKQALMEVAVTAYDLDTRHPCLFTSFDAKKNSDSNFDMRDVAKAATAFPGLFAAPRIASIGGNRSLLCIDGALSGGSPILLGYKYASRITRARESTFAGLAPDPRVIVVSPGTGHYLGSIPYDETNGWGFAPWAAHNAGRHA